jgi:hypothetical protein
MCVCVCVCVVSAHTSLIRYLDNNRLTELSAAFTALTSLQTLLLVNNSIAAVDPIIWQPLLLNGFNLLSMTGNPTQCFVGLVSSFSLTLTVVCECAAGFVGKAVASGQLARGCVERNQSIVLVPAVAVVGSTRTFSMPNASAVVPSLCNATLPHCCNASLVSNTSNSIELRVFSSYCLLVGSGIGLNIIGLQPSQVFYPSLSVAQQAAQGIANLPLLQTSSVAQQGVSNQPLVVAAASNPFVPNVLYPAEIVFQLSSSTVLPSGLEFDARSGNISGVPVNPCPPTQLFVLENNIIFNYAVLLAVVNLSVVECSSKTCFGGVCNYLGNPYDGDYLCSNCPASLTGPHCQFRNPFESTSDDNAAIIASLLSAAVLVAVGARLLGRRLRTWEAKNMRQAQLQRAQAEMLLHSQDISSQLQRAQAEISSMQQLWQILPSELTMQGDIAAGAFGKVMKALWNDIPVAVKCLSGAQTTLDAAAVADFERECEFMKSVRHANIILFFGAGRLEDGTPFLVLELSERGSLRTLLEKASAEAEVIEWGQKLVFARDTALGMQHLHSLGCIHRDLKSGNLLVTQHYHIKVADFGTSKLAASLQANNRASQYLGDGTKTMTKMVGTPLWMAPEQLQGRKSYDNKVDVYAYGIVLFEILTQALPWTELPQKFFMNKLAEAVLSGQRPTVPAEGVVCVDERYVGLMEQCWAQQPQDRPTFRDVVGHPLLQHRQVSTCTSLEASDSYSVVSFGTSSL